MSDINFADIQREHDAADASLRLELGDEYVLLSSDAMQHLRAEWIRNHRAVTHYQMTLEEHRQQRGSYVDPDRYKPGHRDYQPEMLCHTGDGHARGARNRAAVTCPACLRALKRRRAQRTALPALLLGAFLSLGAWGCAAPCKAPADLVAVAQYPDGSFSVDVYGADGTLATTAHLPADARVSDAFPPKGAPQ